MVAGIAVHFGGGALGRGLVVPELAAAGWAVHVVDPLADLVDRLRAGGGYDLAIVDDGAETRRFVPVAGALDAARDGDAVARLLAEAALVTTAVRKENLGRVLAQVAAAWRSHGRPSDVAVVGCENVEHVDVLIRREFAAAGLGVEDLAGVVIPPTVVDRICASGWPESLAIETEAYAELAVQPPAGWSPPPGITDVPDIDAAFDRKRYLVNTLADASAILGVGKGYATLAEAVRDPDISARIAPLIASLIRHLELRHGLDAADLERYRATSERRLGNRGIPRRLETVARDIWRKMQPGERFMAPLIDLEERGALDPRAVEVVAELVLAGAAIEGDRDGAAGRLESLASGGTSGARAVYSAVGAAMRRRR